MFNLHLSIIIPCLNESENLKRLIPEIKSSIKKKFTYEILIVDGIYKDKKTLDISSKNNIKYFNRKKNNDYGNAVRLGIKHSSGKHILFMDGDYSHDPKFIIKLYNKRKNDVVIASRYINGGNSDNTLILKFLSKLLNLFYNIVLNLNLKDVSNSFKLYNGKQLKKLDLNCNHFDIIEEIIFKFKLNNKNSKFKELPYHFRQRKHGKTKRNLIIIFAYLFSILKLRFMS